MAFADEAKSFFDELSNVVNSQQAAKEEGQMQSTDRPFSTLLTQDEEPTLQQDPNQAEESEPEVITRAGG